MWIVLLCGKRRGEIKGRFYLTRCANLCPSVQRFHGRLLPLLEDNCANILLARDYSTVNNENIIHNVSKLLITL